MTTSTSFDRITEYAAIIPIAAAVYFSCRGFIGLGLTVELVIIMTVLFASLSWLLSQALLRFLLIRETNAPMAICVTLLGAIFLITEASLTHIGLEWLLKEGSLHVPGWAVWFFSFALSTTNLFAKWAFLGSPGTRRTTLSTKAANNVVPIDEKTERTMEKIADRMRSV